MYNEKDGDLIKLALEGEFDVVVQGVNCQNVQGAGLAPQFVKAFGSDKFPLESPEFKGDFNKLGQIDYQTGDIFNGKFVWAKSNNFFDGCLTVCNCYTQFNFGRNHADGDEIPFDYTAFLLICKKLNHIFKGKTIGMPKIGAGLAGGDWNLIKAIIQANMKDVKVIIVNYKP